MTRQPNILLIVTDNQPAQSLGCYGNPEIKTPHIDALAKRGTVFEDVHCVNAMCSPCRASVLTGLMPSQHGIHNWLDDALIGKWPKGWSPLADMPTLPSLLKEAGYNTGLVGKFHLGTPDRPQIGFDHWVCLATGHTTQFNGNQVYVDGQRQTIEGHSVPYFGRAMADFIKGQTGSAPFFGMLALNGPYGHWPCIDGRGPEPFAQIYDDFPMDSFPREGIHGDVIKRFAQRAAIGEVREQFTGPLRIPNNLDALRNYAAQISLVDDTVGQVLQTLEDQGLADDTIVVFTADHGFSLGHQGIWGHGAATFPSTMHHAASSVPMIIAGPSLGRGPERRTGLYSQIDLFQTLLNAAGLDHSADHIDSRSMFDAPRDAVFLEQEETRVIRTEDWLYFKRFGGAENHPLQDALFDLMADPGEAKNLADNPEYDSISKTLSQQIADHFNTFSVEAFDLWCGGQARSNSAFAPLWKDAWGNDWKPVV